jgi:hypothetical protein
MNTMEVWAALRRLWEPAPAAPEGEVEEDKNRDEVLVRRTLQRLARAGSVVSLQDEEGAFDHPAKLLDAQENGVTLLLPVGAGQAPDAMPLRLHATTSSDKGVLLFSLVDVVQHGRQLHAPLPQAIVQVQSRRHFRVSAINGPRYRAELVLPQMGKVLRLRNLSEEGVGFVFEGSGVGAGTVLHDAVLRLDGVNITVPVLKIMYSRMHSKQQWTLGGHFQRIGAEEARLLRRWIAAVQASLARPSWEEPGAHERR